MNWSNIIFSLIFIICGLIIYELIRLNTIKKCPKPYIQYKYLPRSFENEQNTPISLINIFNKMFSYPSPWMMSRGIGITDKRNTDLNNRELKVKF